MNIAVFAIALFAGGVIGTLTQLYLGVVVSFLLWFVINIFWFVFVIKHLES